MRLPSRTNGPAAPLPRSGAPMTAQNELWLGRRCFLVKALNVPARTNQRPGVTLLLARGQRLSLELNGRGPLRGVAFLLPPEVPRRFSYSQPHFSLTLEPGHWAYASALRWARDCTSPGSRTAALQLRALSASRATLESLDHADALEGWLRTALRRARRPVVPTDGRLEALLDLIDEAGTLTPTAEEVWGRFRLQHAGSQSHWSRWLHAELGLSLRKVLLGRKLRQAMNLLLLGGSATTVAHEAGFADSSHLSRLTERTFGLGPREANDRKILQVFELRAAGR